MGVLTTVKSDILPINMQVVVCCIVCSKIKVENLQSQGRTIV